MTGYTHICIFPEQGDSVFIEDSRITPIVTNGKCLSNSRGSVLLIVQGVVVVGVIYFGEVYCEGRGRNVLVESHNVPILVRKAVYIQNRALAGGFQREGCDVWRDSEQDECKSPEPGHLCRCNGRDVTGDESDEK